MMSGRPNMRRESWKTHAKWCNVEQNKGEKLAGAHAKRVLCIVGNYGVNDDEKKNSRKNYDKKMCT